ncbi:hypothetical protein GCM10009416_47220 [Craurococcus roseus]|uniref:Uncharacterized protein n=1 Tax=Craurococcus roseus TaxID=77585 RepID=A0ABP3RAK7_9PROT
MEFARRTVLNHNTGFADPISAFSALGEGSWDARRLDMKAGHALMLATGGGQPRIGGHTILCANIPTSNGYCHGLNGGLEIE